MRTTIIAVIASSDEMQGSRLQALLGQAAWRGELIRMKLDRTGVLVSYKVAFSPWSTPLALRPSI